MSNRQIFFFECIAFLESICLIFIAVDCKSNKSVSFL
jgi:hypothetical protein